MSTSWPLRPLNTPPPFAKPETCKSCPLYGNGKGFGYPTVGGGNGVGFVGEASGEEEEKSGTFFEGSAGWQLNHVLKRGGMKREDFAFLDNVLHCRPPNNHLAGMPYEAQAIAHCATFLDSTIAAVQPKAIVALGNIPMRRLTSQSGISRNRGFIFETLQGIPVVPTYHPSYLLPRRKQESTSKYTWVVIMDIRKALRVARGERRNFKQHYLLDPSMDVAQQFVGEWLQESPNPMAWDLETAYSLSNWDEQEFVIEGPQQVIRFSMAFRQGYALTMPYTPEAVEKIIRPVFEANKPKTDWNGLGFDRPIMVFQEHLTFNGTLYDAMDQFHVFQPNLRRNLEFVASIFADHLKPWKYLSHAEPKWYSAQDADANITNFIGLKEAMGGYL